MSLENRIGSAVNLAKSELMAMDLASIDTKIRTQTLKLLLDVLIELGTSRNPQHMKMEDAAAKFVVQRTARINAAFKERQDADAS